MADTKKFSAQVILRAASGKKIEPTAQIIAANVAEYLPAAKAVDKVSKELQAKGFQVGKCVGNSFSITGPASLFESVFRQKIDASQGQVQFANVGYELPHEKIPAVIRPEVSHITFTAPPDFGPGNMSTME